MNILNFMKNDKNELIFSFSHKYLQYGATIFGSFLSVFSYKYYFRDIIIKFRLQKFLLKKKTYYVPLKMPFLERPRMKSYLRQRFTKREGIYLLEGYEGIGMTTFVKQFIDEESQNRIALYISLRELEDPKKKPHEIISKQIGYAPTYLLFQHELDYENALYLLEEIIKKICKKKNKSEEKTYFPLIIFDDAQLLFKKKHLENLKNYLLGRFALIMNDTRLAQIVFASNDNSIESEIREMSGMRLRLKYINFEGVTETNFLKYIQDNQDFFKYDLNEYKMFYRDFSSNFRELESFVRAGKKYEDWYEKSAKKYIVDIDIVWRNIQFRNILMHMYINKGFFNWDKFQKLNEKEIKSLEKSVKKLIKKGIIRESKAKNLNDIPYLYYEFNSKIIQTVAFRYIRNRTVSKLIL